MGLFSSLVRTALDVAVTPVALAADVLDIGDGEGFTRTTRQAEKVVTDVEKVGEAVDDLI